MADDMYFLRLADIFEERSQDNIDLFAGIISGLKCDIEYSVRRGSGADGPLPRTGAEELAAGSAIGGDASVMP